MTTESFKDLVPSAPEGRWDRRPVQVPLVGEVGRVPEIGVASTVKGSPGSLSR